MLEFCVSRCLTEMFQSIADKLLVLTSFHTTELLETFIFRYFVHLQLHIDITSNLQDNQYANTQMRVDFFLNSNTRQCIRVRYVHTRHSLLRI